MLDINKWELSKLLELFVYNEDKPMLFNSGLFLFLFIGFFIGYVLIEKAKTLRIIYVILFSLYFYYKSSGFFFFLLIFSTIVDYLLGFLIYSSLDKGRKTLFLVLSIWANLGLLAYFKYTNFFIGTFNGITGAGLSEWDIFLPVGISFYTFQTMSYSIDIYRGKLKPVSNILDFAFFVSFFPQLVAGPIVRAADFLPQIRRDIRVSREDIGKAFFLICGGLFKKAVISDYISINFVERVFDNPTLYSGFENLMGLYGYALQIYCDFSGYSDMAIGFGLIMGFKLPVNFMTPYQAFSLQNFWRRWHISLSSWLRDYLYISLGGNRKGKIRTYVNLMLTMLLGGLWHGANWKFVVWGALHGIGLAIERLLQEVGGIFRLATSRTFVLLFLVHLIFAIGIPVKQLALEGEITATGNLLMKGNAFLFLFEILLFGLGYGFDKLIDKFDPEQGGIFTKGVSIFYVFHFVCICWVFFRASSFEVGIQMLSQISLFFANIFETSWTQYVEIIVGYKYVFMVMVFGYLLHFVPSEFDRVVEEKFMLSPWLVKSLVLAVIIWMVIQTSSSEVQPFIYFQF